MHCRGFAQRCQLIDAGYGKPGRHSGMIELHHRQLRPGRPAGHDHRSARAESCALFRDQVERRFHLRDNCRQAGLRRQRVAGHGHRPAMGEKALGIMGEQLAGIALPIAAMDEDEAGGTGRARIEIQLLPGAGAIGNVQMGLRRRAEERRGNVPRLHPCRAGLHRGIVVVGGIPLGLGQGVPNLLRGGMSRRCGRRAHAATAWGRMTASASNFLPARRQKAGVSRRSATTFVSSLSRSRKRPRWSSSTEISAA